MIIHNPDYQSAPFEMKSLCIDAGSCEGEQKPYESMGPNFRFSAENYPKAVEHAKKGEWDKVRELSIPPYRRVTVIASGESLKTLVGSDPPYDP